MLLPALVLEVFGRDNFGAIFGLAQGISLIGMLAGPPLAGWVFDEFGSYQHIWFAFAAVILAAVFLVATMPKPPRANKSVGHPTHKIGMGQATDKFYQAPGWEK